MLIDDFYEEVESEATRLNCFVVDRLFTHFLKKLDAAKNTSESCAHQYLKNEYVSLKRAYSRTKAFYLREYGPDYEENYEERIYSENPCSWSLSGIWRMKEQWKDLRGKYRNIVACNHCDACKKDEERKEFCRNRRRLVVEQSALARARRKMARETKCLSETIACAMERDNRTLLE